MRYLEQVKTENNSFISYLKGSLIFIFFHFLGQIPLYIYLISKSPNIEGYRDQNEITSLRGTLVPAKNLNKLISKIPIIGDIVIPKDVGEGLFGISFKMKGPPGRIKTSINPIRTLTPRFIQKIIDKRKTK